MTDNTQVRNQRLNQAAVILGATMIIISGLAIAAAGVIAILFQTDRNEMIRQGIDPDTRQPFNCPNDNSDK